MQGSKATAGEEKEKASRQGAIVTSTSWQGQGEGEGRREKTMKNYH
jgi:hypothetical protein